jgi:hypothetical protein
MRNVYKLLIVVLFFIPVGCNKYLDKPHPTGAININNLNSVEEFQTLLAGVYNGIQNYGGRLLYLSESMTDFVDWRLSFTDYRQVGFHSMNSNNEPARLIWDQLYKAINDANIIIAKLDDAANATEEQKENLLGQAYCLRGLMYYFLVQYYAKPWDPASDNSQLGVPLMLDPIISSDDFKDEKRSSVKEVYDQIEKDLQEAEKLKITNTSPAKVTSYAVAALRSRIALIQERWNDAAELASEVIPHYSLLPDVKSFFREPLGAESIFEIVNLPSDVAGGGNYSISVVHNLNGRDGVRITDAYRDELKKIITENQQTKLDNHNLAAVDTRITELLTTHAAPPLTLDLYTHTDKYEDGVNLADNAPVLRLPEMILTRAEALAELNGVNQESIDLLNEIRTRAIKVVDKNGNEGDPSLIEFAMSDFQNKEELVSTIFRERGVELSYEGHRKTDLQRRKMNVRDLPWNSDALVFPIPQTQIDASANIQQNPGY